MCVCVRCGAIKVPARSSFIVLRTTAGIAWLQEYLLFSWSLLFPQKQRLLYFGEIILICPLFLIFWTASGVSGIILCREARREAKIALLRDISFPEKKSSCSGCFFETAIIYFSSDPDYMSTKSVINRLPLDELKGRAGKGKKFHSHSPHFPIKSHFSVKRKIRFIPRYQGTTVPLLSPFSLFDRVITLPAKQEKHLIDGGRREKKRNSKFENSGGRPTCRRHSLFPFDSILSIRYLLLLTMRDTEGRNRP